MNGLDTKKVVLWGLLLLLGIPILFMPMAAAYGTGFNDAETIPKGTHNDVLLSADGWAYFKFYCFKNTEINVSLSYNETYYLWLLIFDPDKYEVERNSNPSSYKSLNHTCLKNGYYFLQIYRYFSLGDIPFEVEIDYTGFVPGFEFPIIILGVLMIIGLVIVTQKPRKFSFFF